MSTTATTFKSKHSDSDKWRKQNNVITHNDVIDAYLKGKEVGRNQQEVALKNLFNQNLEKAKNVSETLFSKVSDKGISVNSIHLKADEITSFLALVITSKDDYIKDEFSEAIKISRELKNKTENESFKISFSFTYDADTLNKNCLDSDGYFLKYGHKL